MHLRERFQRARERRDARVLGRRAALGLASSELIDLRATEPMSSTACPSCGEPSDVEVLDLTTGQSTLRCRSCEHRWLEALPRARHHAAQ